jgi:hypothetical protein
MDSSLYEMLQPPSDSAQKAASMAHAHGRAAAVPL